jgi:hypothetical protein
MAVSTHDRSLLIRRPDQISGEWLGEVLGVDDLVVVSVNPIGTGQMSLNHRVRFETPSGPNSVVIKLASEDEGSRSTGVGMGVYDREVAFYNDFSTSMRGSLAGCHLAVYDPAEGWFTLVLEDMVGAVAGDQILGSSQQQARLALRALAGLQAPILNDDSVGSREYLSRPTLLTQALLSSVLPDFLARHGDRITDEHAQVCRTFVAVADAWDADRRAPLGLIHGDYRLDNLLFTDDSCTVVDWQTVSWGPALRDAAYFVGTGLSDADRRHHERDLVRFYYDELVRGGVDDFSWQQCWDEYRRQTFASLRVTIFAGVVVERTDRGDDMLMALLARTCQQILDLDALSLLPGADAPRAALQPQPSDEGRHHPGPEPLWNESWYFDAVDDSETLGVYVRIGRIPNQGHCFYSAAIVRPGHPALMVVDNAAPLDDTDGAVETVVTDALRSTLHCTEPLTRFHVTLDATAQAHTDHSAPLRDEAGQPVPVSLELTWDTDGIPYAWRTRSRYEIPCRVTGVIRIGDQEFPFAGPGQRDHSWGLRDWWANDWMWSAFHLNDGTHTHAVTVPSIPGGLVVGYVQCGDTLSEVQTVAATQTVDTNGLIRDAQVVTGLDYLTLDVEPLAFGALLLVADDGRISHFPRAMARVRAADGRTGIGWIEWNRNQPRQH